MGLLSCSRFSSSDTATQEPPKPKPAKRPTKTVYYGEVVYVNKKSGFVLIKTSKPATVGNVLSVFNESSAVGKVNVTGESSRGVIAADILEGELEKGYKVAKRVSSFSEG